MPYDGSVNSNIDLLGRVIVKRSVKSLFRNFCHEIMQFSDQISIEFTSFEISFYSADGIFLRVSPYSELFLVSIGENRSVDLRVSDRDGFVRGLDISLKHYLDSLSEICK